MVCIYCGQETAVVNSRPQKRSNHVWRRRHCLACGAVFSSIEQPAYDQSLLVIDATSHNWAFSRDQLFLSLYDACKHRKTAVSDATALTQTVVTKLMRSVHEGTVQKAEIRRLTSQTLAAFDQVAQTHYDAFHQSG